MLAVRQGWPRLQTNADGDVSNRAEQSVMDHPGALREIHIHMYIDSRCWNERCFSHLIEMRTHICFSSDINWDALSGKSINNDYVQPKEIRDVSFIIVASLREVKFFRAIQENFQDFTRIIISRSRRRNVTYAFIICHNLSCISAFSLFSSWFY